MKTAPRKRPLPVLLIESEGDERERIGQMLRRFGFHVFETRTLDEATQAVFRRGPFAGIVCDQELPDGCGLNFVQWLREQVIACPVTLMVDNPRGLPARNGRFDFLPKPVEPGPLYASLARLGLFETHTTLAA